MVKKACIKYSPSLLPSPTLHPPEGSYTIEYIIASEEKRGCRKDLFLILLQLFSFKLLPKYSDFLNSDVCIASERYHQCPSKTIWTYLKLLPRKMNFYIRFMLALFGCFFLNCLEGLVIW